MDKIKLPSNRGKVAGESCEPKLESCEKVAELDLDKLLESEPKKKSSYNGYTEARKKNNAEWAKKQAQIAIRISPEVKTAIDTHVRARGESLAGFIVRAAKLQMERDNAES